MNRESIGLDVAYVGECENVLLGLRDEGHCGYCPSGSPICGSDGVTYGSMCDLQCRAALAKAPGKRCITVCKSLESKVEFEQQCL